MKIYELPEPKDYESFINFYRNVMREGKEEEAFLGTDAKYRIRERDSYDLDSTDISVLMEYCLFPLYAEGDKDIVRRTFEILKDFSLSIDLVKLDKVTDYIFIQNRRLKRYISLPFVIKTDELVRNIIESISNLSDEQKKDWLYQGLCNALDRDPLYRQCDEEKVEKILKLPDTEEEHLLKLQEKLNNYIYFLESKQYVERYGDKFDKKVIHITFQYSPSDNGLAFLAAVQKVLQPTDMSLKVELPE